MECGDLSPLSSGDSSPSDLLDAPFSLTRALDLPAGDNSPVGESADKSAHSIRVWSAVTCHRFSAGDSSPPEALDAPFAQILGATVYP